MPRQTIAVILSLSILLISEVLSAQEERETLTITTYYPAPYGVYKTLRLYPTDDINPNDSCSNGGEMYFDETDSQIYFCDGNKWVVVGGSYWSRVEDTTTDIYNTDLGNVGIGTEEPQAKLHVYYDSWDPNWVNSLRIGGNETDAEVAAAIYLDGASDWAVLTLNKATFPGIGEGAFYIYNIDAAKHVFGVDKDGETGILKGLAIGKNYMPLAYMTVTSLPENGMIIEGNVGIGTENPQSSQDSREVTLDVAENIVAKDIYLDTPKSGSKRWASESTPVVPGTLCGAILKIDPSQGGG